MGLNPNARLSPEMNSLPTVRRILNRQQRFGDILSENPVGRKIVGGKRAILLGGQREGDSPGNGALRHRAHQTRNAGIVAEIAYGRRRSESSDPAGL